MHGVKLTILALALTILAASACFALPTPKATEARWDAYTDPDGVGMFIYWCKPTAAPCVDSDFVDAQRVDVQIPPQDPENGEHVVNVLNAIAGAKAKLCFRNTAYDASGNESAFGTLATGEDGCGWFGMANAKNQKVK